MQNPIFSGDFNHGPARRRAARKRQDDRRIRGAGGSQAATGIEALPISIGDGDNAETNLYWGNDEGFKGTFDRSKKWKLIDKNETPNDPVCY